MPPTPPPPTPCPGHQSFYYMYYRVTIGYLHALCQKMYFFKIVLSPGFFFLIPGCRKRMLVFFYSLVFLFNQKGKWSIGTRCNILFFFLNQIFHHVWNYSHFSVYFGVVNEYLMYCMFSFVKVIKSGP